MTAGRESSEWAKTFRAECLGAFLVACGLALTIWRDSLQGPAVIAVGAYLVAHTAAAYAASRGAHKAAASRPRIPSAPGSL